MNAGQGSLSFSQKNAIAGGGPPFQLNSAYNGLSVDPVTGQIVLGDDLGFTGPADLVSDREIAMQGNTLQLSQLNTFGFSNWRFNIEPNFMAIADTGGIGSYMLWSVDFAGNTGQFIGNNRASAGWSPPFIAIQNTDVGGTFGRLQFSGQDAMEMTDAGPTNAIAIFPTGDVAVQQSGLADPNYKFFVLNNGTLGGQMRVQNAAATLFEINDSTGFYQLGDISNNTGGSFLSINDPGAVITMNILNSRVLNLDRSGQIYQIGDIDVLNNQTIFTIDDTASTGDLSSSASNAAFSINGNTGASGTFTTVDLKTVTVEGGIITLIV